MARFWLIMLGIAAFLQPFAAEAQHCHRGFGFREYSQPWVVNPGLGYSGFMAPGYRRQFIYQVGNVDPYAPDTSFPAPIQQVAYPMAGNSLLDGLQKPVVIEPSKVPVAPSSTAARLRSLEHQARGDQRLRQQKWSEARAAYRSSVDAAPDRAEAHLRLGLCLVTIQRFEAAIHEFKRALFIDPLIPQAGMISKGIFGPDSQMVRTSIVSKLTDWVSEDYADSDRLFLMGVILHFEGDPRGKEFFEAALRMKRKGDVSHIALFIGEPEAINNDPADDPIPAIPKLQDKPVPVLMPKPAKNAGHPKPLNPLPGAPVPMPDL